VPTWLRASLVATSLLLSSAWLLDSPIHAVLLVAGAAGAGMVYALDRQSERQPVEQQRGGGLAHSVPGLRLAPSAHLAPAALLALPVLLILLVAARTSSLPQRVWLAGAVAGALGLWYGLPGSWSLKCLLGAWRSPVIAFVWGGGVVLLPALAMNNIPWLLVAVLAAYRTAWLLPNVLAAEYADRQVDREAGNPGLTATWTRRVFFRVAVGVCVAALVVGACAALLLTSVGVVTMTRALVWFALDAAGLAAFAILMQPHHAITRHRVIYFDAIAAWPVIPAAVFLV